MRSRIFSFLLSAVSVALCAPQGAEAHTGYGIAVDREERVVFLDSLRSRVWRIERDGRLTVLANGIHANPLIQDAAGNLYAEDFNKTLWKISADGRKTKVHVPARTAMTGGRVGSLDELIAVDAEGNLYFHAGNDFRPQPSQILKLTPQGEWSLLADGRGRTAQFKKIYSACWGPEGALYLAEETGVRRVAPDGTVTTVAGGELPGFMDGQAAAARFNRVLSVTVDASGNAFVADSDNFLVRKIARDGEVTTLLRTTPPWKPTGVAVSRDTVYVLERQFVPTSVGIKPDTLTHRVLRVAPDGRVVTLATVSGDLPRSPLVLLAGGILGLGVVAAGMVFFWRFRRTHTRGESCSSELPS